MKRMLSVCLVLMLLVTAVPAVSSAATYGYVTGGWLRLRSSPSFDSSTVASYYTGTVVEILSTSGNWYNVKMPDAKTGYMYSSYITFSSGGSGTAYITSTNGYGVRMRSGPSTGYRIIGVYSVGTAVTILEVGTNWDKVQIGSTVGFIMSQYLTSGGSTGVTATVWSSNGLGVRLRSGPGTGYGIIGVYSVGTTVTILTPGTTWDYIRVGSRTGYMMNSYLNTSGPAVASSIIIAPATTTAAQGGTVALTTTVSGTNLSNPAYTLAITQNDTMATLSGNTLTVSGTATIGSVIIVTATSVDNGGSGSKISATCNITVASPSTPTPTPTSTPVVSPVTGVWTGTGRMGDLSKGITVIFDSTRFVVTSRSYKLQGTYTQSGATVTMQALGLSLPMTVSLSSPRTMTGSLSVDNYTATINLTGSTSSGSVDDAINNTSKISGTLSALLQWLIAVGLNR
jgi:uncharacterized protein YgiM (DUF1202 family)